MIWLALGVALWCGVHFIPSLGKSLKIRFIESYGEKFYKTAFSLTVVSSIALMVLGWRLTSPEALYQPPVWAGPLAAVLMVLGFLLFGAAKHQTIIKRYIRHPQLTGVAVWAIAHLIANGDNRSVVLFGVLGLWALVEMPLINAREGAWIKPESPPIGVELKGHAISLVIFAAALFLHPYFAGVSPIAG